MSPTRIALIVSILGFPIGCTTSRSGPPSSNAVNFDQNIIDPRSLNLNVILNQSVQIQARVSEGFDITIVSLPFDGDLFLGTTPIELGTSIPAQDLALGNLIYHHRGLSLGADHFAVRLTSTSHQEDFYFTLRVNPPYPDLSMPPGSQTAGSKMIEYQEDTFFVLGHFSNMIIYKKVGDIWVQQIGPLLNGYLNHAMATPNGILLFSTTNVFLLQPNETGFYAQDFGMPPGFTTITKTTSLIFEGQIIVQAWGQTEVGSRNRSYILDLFQPQNPWLQYATMSYFPNAQFNLQLLAHDAKLFYAAGGYVGDFVTHPYYEPEERIVRLLISPNHNLYLRDHNELELNGYFETRAAKVLIDGDYLYLVQGHYYIAPPPGDQSRSEIVVYRTHISEIPERASAYEEWYQAQLNWETVVGPESPAGRIVGPGDEFNFQDAIFENGQLHLAITSQQSNQRPNNRIVRIQPSRNQIIFDQRRELGFNRGQDHWVREMRFFDSLINGLTIYWNDDSNGTSWVRMRGPL